MAARISLCGGSIGSRRALLAAVWSVVSLLTAIAFLTAFIFALSTQNNEDDEYYGNNGRYNNYYNNNEGSQDMEDENGRSDPEVAVTSRALAFSALWTGVMAALLSVFGTVILGWQSPTGQYYTCCSSSVHRTTPLGLGSFIGALLMFANLTLTCSVLFGDFEVSCTKKRYRDNVGGTCVPKPNASSVRCRSETVGKGKIDRQLLLKSMDRGRADYPWHFPFFV